MIAPMPSPSGQILEILQEDPRTKDAPIEVAFSQGMVTLSGRVKSEEVRDAAEELTRSHPNVISVINELKVG